VDLLARRVQGLFGHDLRVLLYYVEKSLFVLTPRCCSLVLASNAASIVAIVVLPLAEVALAKVSNYSDDPVGSRCWYFLTHT